MFATFFGQSIPTVTNFKLPTCKLLEYLTIDFHKEVRASSGLPPTFGIGCQMGQGMHWSHGGLCLSGTSSLEKWLPHLPVVSCPRWAPGVIWDNSAPCITLSALSEVTEPVWRRNRPWTCALSALSHLSSFAQKSQVRLQKLTNSVTIVPILPGKWGRERENSLWSVEQWG